MVYLEEIKRSAVEELFSGKTAKQVCEEYGLSNSTLRHWEVEQVVQLPAGKSEGSAWC